MFEWFSQMWQLASEQQPFLVVLAIGTLLVQLLQSIRDMIGSPSERAMKQRVKDDTALLRDQFELLRDMYRDLARPRP